MGSCSSVNTISSNVLMIGLDGSGKTALLYRMMIQGQLVMTAPTIGFNVEQIGPIDGVHITFWDIGGQEKIRPLWIHYFDKKEGVIFVVDSSDTERIQVAKEELTAALKSSDLASLPVLILANKQDLPDVLTAEEVSTVLRLDDWTDRMYAIQGVSAATGDGVEAAAKKLANLLKEARVEQKKK